MAEKYDFLVIADDIYCALNYTDNRKAICSYEKSPKRVITLYSYSKDYCMTGLRLGHIIASKELIATMRRVNEAVTFTINSMAQKGRCLCNQESEGNPERLVQRILRQRNVHL